MQTFHLKVRKAAQRWEMQKSQLKNSERTASVFPFAMLMDTFAMFEQADGLARILYAG